MTDTQNTTEELSLDKLVARDFPALSSFALTAEPVFLSELFDFIDGGQDDDLIKKELPEAAYAEFLKVIELGDDDRLSIIEALLDSLSPEKQEMVTGG